MLCYTVAENRIRNDTPCSSYSKLACSRSILDIFVSFILLEPGFTFDCFNDKQNSNVLFPFRLFSLDLLNALRYQGSEDIICMRWQTNCLHVTVVCAYMCSLFRLLCIFHWFPNICLFLCYSNQMCTLFIVPCGFWMCESSVDFWLRWNLVEFWHFTRNYYCSALWWLAYMFYFSFFVDLMYGVSILSTTFDSGIPYNAHAISDSLDYIVMFKLALQTNLWCSCNGPFELPTVYKLKQFRWIVRVIIIMTNKLVLVLR